jgi:tRNA-intron endonuclease
MIEIELVGDLFIVDQQSSQALLSKGFGKKDNNLFQLEPCEVLYLIEKKKAKVLETDDNKITSKFRKSKTKELSFKQVLKRKQVSINDYIVYKDLKSKGYQVKSGLKYGFRFRVYDKGIKKGDDHSLWLVEPITETDNLKIKDIAGKNRIAHTTRKKMLFAIVDNEDSVTYLETSWKRL